MADLNKDRPYTVGDDIDLDEIVHNAVSSVASDTSRGDVSLRTRLALFLAAIIVVANSVIGIYNSLALRQEVTCNHQLNNAVNIVGDQNRNITKNVIDTVLSGKKLTAAQLVQVRKDYDTQFDANTQKRAALLKTTCNDGSKPSTSQSPVPTSVVPSK